MSFHFSAQNDTISQVKLPITELVIHTTPTELIHSKIRKSTFPQLLSALLQPTGRTVSCAFTPHPGGPSHFPKSTSHLEILCRNIQKCEGTITRDLLSIDAVTSTDAKRLMYTNKDVRYNRRARGVFLSPASWCRWMLSAADPESTLGHYNKERGSTKPGEWRAWEGSYSGTPLGTQPWHSHLSQLHQSYSYWHSCPRRPGRPPGSRCFADIVLKKRTEKRIGESE